MKIKRLMWVCLLLCCSGTLWAAEQGVEKIDDVVVTATRTSTDLQHIGGTSLTLITAEEIEARHLTSVVDILNTVPGLQISSTGGLGTTSKIYMRGADSKNTLLIIDGVSANDPSDPNRGADFSNITLDNVERIEVVRGAMSVLYGSNATAGVINIITKSGAEKIHGYAGAETGSYNTYKVYGGLNGSEGISDFSLSVSSLSSDGYSIANADNNDISHAGNTSEKDEWENTTFSGKITLDLSSNTSLTAVIRYVDATMDLDDNYYSFLSGGGFAADRTIFWGSTLDPTGRKKNQLETTKLFGKLNLHNQLFDGKLVSDFDYKYSRQERDAEDNDGNDYYDFLGKSDEWSWQGTLQVLPFDFVTAGIGYLQERSDSSSAATVEAETMSCWLQNQLIVSGFDVVAGVHYDDHDRFGGKTTWRIAPAYHFDTTGTTLHASYATGFRSPSLYEMYSANGNKNLDPEKSQSCEFGVGQSLLNNRLQSGVTYYWMEFDDRIAWDSSIVIPGAPWAGGYNQLDGDSKTEGFEVFTKFQVVETLLLSLDYTYTDTQDPDGLRMVRRPLNKVHAGLRYTFLTTGSINVDGYWFDERDAITSARDAQGNAISTLDDYFLVNLAAHYDVTDILRVYARIDNLFDEHYEEAWSYATAGQSFYAGIKLTF
ncbi:MAG: TonB-dependent receptor [Thermodesulfobacteriota bacterium]|nr:TonB-dependent receptor [Thermodesulfobacteriota bacterium]